MVRVRTSSVLSAESIDRVGKGADQGLHEPVQVGGVERLVDQLRRRRQRAVPLHLVHRRQQTGTQGVDLASVGVAACGELEGERLAADAETAGGVVDADQHEPLGEAVDPLGLRGDGRAAHGSAG